MEVGSVEHVVTQMSHKQPAREVAMERLGHKLIFPYLIHNILYVFQSAKVQRSGHTAKFICRFMMSIKKTRKVLAVSEKLITFASDFEERFILCGGFPHFWKVGRVIDRAGLEIRYTPFGYRGFESLTFRKKSSMSNIVGLSFLSQRDIIAQFVEVEDKEVGMTACEQAALQRSEQAMPPADG